MFLSGSHLESARDAVLDVCRRYLDFAGDAEDGVNKEWLAGKLKAVEERRFALLVAGEAGAGKSTLINALVGQRVLPTHILQGSPEVIDIRRSGRKRVEVTYADDRREVNEDDPEAFLHRIAAVDDRYRQIPTRLLDELLVDGWRPGDPIDFGRLERESGCDLDKEDRDLVKAYMRTRAAKDIPKRISFGLPLGDAYEDVHLVDSPGVNSTAGLGRATREHLQYKADAIVFVQSIEGPVGDSAFRKFVAGAAPNFGKSMLCLALTNSAGKSPAEIRKKLGGYRKQFDHWFAGERVQTVDSLLKIMSREIAKYESLDALMQHYKQEEKARPEDPAPHDQRMLLRSLEFDSANDVRSVQSELERRSNFQQLEAVLQEISKRGPQEQLVGLLEKVRHGYSNQASESEDNIRALEAKRKDPQVFEGEIAKIQSQYEEIEDRMHTFNERVLNQFSGNHPQYQRDLERLCETAVSDLKGAKRLDVALKILADFAGECSAFSDTQETAIRNCCEEAIDGLDLECELQRSIRVPRPDFESITGKAKKWLQKVQNTHGQEFWRNLRRWEKQKEKGEYTIFVVFMKVTIDDHNKHLRNVVSKAMSRIDEYSDRFSDSITDFAAITETIEASLAKVLDERRTTLGASKAKLEDNQEVGRRLAVGRDRLRKVEEELYRVAELWEELV